MSAPPTNTLNGRFRGVCMWMPMKRSRPMIPVLFSGVRLPQDRPVVTVCGMGRTSAIAAQQLRDRGYQAFTLIGGMKAWSLAWNSAELNLETVWCASFRYAGRARGAFPISSGAEIKLQ